MIFEVRQHFLALLFFAELLEIYDFFVFVELL